ncbi:MAG: proprotein convertase P-domain-containing protein [Saprospiraceae bacterium]|nr:proprotein convertase P-domain-containing protein [Saprospiraceae bacterium]
MKIRPLFSLFLLLACVYQSTAQSLWTDVAGRDLSTSSGERRIVPKQYRTVQLDLQALPSVLSAAPLRYSAEAANQNAEISLPMPDGSFQRFRLYASPVMAPELQAQFPETQCYTGIGIDNPSARLKCDFTPWGFHAMVLTPGESPMFIDPFFHGNQEFYTVYYKKDLEPSKEDAMWTCETEHPEEELRPGIASPESNLNGDCMLRTYRLALACTGEYATFHGGTKPLVLAAMNTSMNRVNGLYENDLAVTMVIIPNNDLIIYLNANTDPYTNTNGGTMLGENVTNINTVIGAANYDIGHVFSTGGGGIAGLGVVCGSGKARGVTGGGSPIGDAFDIDYVAHEMGHQFAANHTQNNNCNRVASASMEPGSASTIMGYAGICSPNVQNNSDDYFHAISLQEIYTFIITGNGNTCPVKTSTGNNNPVVNGGGDYIIPKSTPFILTATGSDADGDTLTYCWEQMDPAFATMPPVSTSATGPLFRSYKGTTSPSRYFPRLQDLNANINSTWEELPGVARSMKFRVTVRDNNFNASCTDEDDVVVTVNGTAGPFVVTAPNTNVTWIVGTPQTVTWNVAGTDIAPVNCTSVRLLLSIDGGITYPIVLAENVPNNGTYNIVTPNNISTLCRVKVESVGNIFFDISNQNFKIELPPSPTFLLSTTTSSQTACAGDSVEYTINALSLAGFDSPVAISVTGAPAGATVLVSPDTLVPSGNAVVTVKDLTPAMTGIYTLTVTALGGAISQSLDLQLSVLPAALSTPSNLLSPTNGTVGQSQNTTLVWNATTYASDYEVVVATSPAFGTNDIVSTFTGSDTTYNVANLTLGTVYYWQVKPVNGCGEGPWSSVFAFQTGLQACDQSFSSTNVPLIIDASVAGTVTSVINIPVSRVIDDVNVSVDADHTWVGDLDAKLISPGGDTVQLFDRPGVVDGNGFGCAGDNVDLVFDDQSSQTADLLENTCNGTSPALAGSFQSIDVLAAYNGENSTGDWKLLVTDNYPDDGGTLTAWSLIFCFPNEITAGSMLNNLPLTVGSGTTTNVPSANLHMTLSDGAALGVFTLLQTPQHGTLTLDGVALTVGSSFTQADIDAGKLAYVHNGDAATSDDFHFDALDTNNDAWLHNAVFQIVVVQNTLTVSAAQTQDIICGGNNTGQITATAAGLVGDLTYSINGGTPQTSNLFNDLSAGTYTITVTGPFGFTATSNEVVIDEPQPLQLTATAVSDMVTANGSGGTGVLEYSIDGMTFQSSNVFGPLADGVYTLTLRDESGCTKTVQVVVSVNSFVVAVQQVGGITCNGDNNAVISVIAGGGEAPYTYSLDGLIFQSDSVFTGLGAGIYEVTVKDNSGLTIQTNAVTITEPDVVSVDAVVTLNAITAAGSGGTGILEYSIDGVNFQSSNVFTDLPNGVYTVTVQDENGCSDQTIAIVAVDALVGFLQQTADIQCHGDNTAEIIVAVNGGVLPYNYSINGEPNQDDPTFSNLGGGTYNVLVTDAAGSTTTLTIVIDEPLPLNTVVTVTDNDATLSTTGGTGSFVYAINGVAATYPEDFQDLPLGDYVLTVTDGNGCTSTTSFSVLGNTITSDLFSAVEPGCAGDANGEVQICINGGYLPLTVVINNPDANIANVNGQCETNVLFSNLVAGLYTIVITDSEGFTNTLSFNIEEPAVLVASASSTGDSIIGGASGGTGNVQYSLDGVNFQTDNVFTNLPNGDYTLTVQDENGCKDNANVTVNNVSTVDPASQWGLLVSPNPGAGLFRLHFGQAPSEFHADVFDATGKLLHNQHFSTSGGEFQTVLALDHLPQGMYLLRLTDGQNTGAVRLVVQK